MGFTTKYFARHSGVIQNPITRYAHHSGSWQAILGRWAKHGGVWQLTYSTPSVSVSNTGAATGSGASAAGTTSASVTATPGGYRSGSQSYSYAYVSGDTGFYISAGAGTTTPTMSHDFSGVANGSTSSGVSATWSCTMTDTVTGATTTFNFTVGAFAWQNTIPAYTAPSVSSFNNMSGSQNHSGTVLVTTGDGGGAANPNITIANGQAPFSYSWSNFGGSGPGQTLASGGTTLVPVFTANCANGVTSSYTWRCTITDAMSNQCHCDVTVALNNN